MTQYEFSILCRNITYIKYLIEFSDGNRRKDLVSWCKELEEARDKMIELNPVIL